MKWDTFTAKPAPKFKSKSEKFVSDLFSDAITQNGTEPYTPQLRGSSLPICILLHAHDLVKPHERPTDSRLEHYSIQGTVFHEWYQKKLMHSKKWGKFVFGDFECANCEDDKSRKEKYVPYRFQCRPSDFKTHECPQCGNKGLRYRELEGKYKGTIGIHVDMVLKFPGEKFWVLEFKTTGRYQIDDVALKFKPKHFHQASTYPVILNEVFGIMPEKFFIGYVNRDAPQFSKTAKRQHRWFSFKTDSFAEIRKAQLDKITRGERARKRYFADPTLENLKKLDDCRPCKSLSDYEKPLIGMKDRFESSESCPFVKDGKCGCFKSGKLSTAAQELHAIVTGESDAKRVKG